jgi:type IV secretion system protein VirD4
VTVYVCLPLDVLEVCGKFFRLILGSALSELLREDGLGGGVRTLVLMDEFFQLGRLDAIQNAMGMARGFQTQLWCILNDLSQLHSLYGQTAETFMNNAGVRMWLAARDEVGSRYVSEQCGDGEARSISKSIGYAADTDWDRVGTVKPHVNVSYGQTPRKLILPHEVRELNDDEMILFVEKVKGAILAKRKPYFKIPELNERAGLNPYFKGRQAKRDGRNALVRSLLGR